jgi:hypothetical protein
VQDERFDLIVANPPYVISPDSTYAYRDSGLPADQLCYQVVKAAAEHLTEGGFAHVLVSWAHAVDGDWADPLRGWVDGTECDAWLLHYRTSDPIAHAAGWLRPLGESDPDRYTEALDRWLEYLARLRIEAIGYGAVVLRRREGRRNWIRTDPLPLDRLEPAGEHTLRVFAAQDALEHLDDEGCSASRSCSPTPTGSSRRSPFAEPSWSSQTLELTEGMRFTVGVDRHALAPRTSTAGVRSARARARARTFELDPRAGAFRARGAPVVRRLLELGFLDRPRLLHLLVGLEVPAGARCVE